MCCEVRDHPRATEAFIIQPRSSLNQTLNLHKTSRTNIAELVFSVERSKGVISESCNNTVKCSGKSVCHTLS